MSWPLAKASFVTCNSAVLHGDSISGYYNPPLTIISAVRSGNLVTVNINAHGLVDQQPIRTFGITNDDSFNGLYTITKIDSNNFSYPSVGPDGTASGSSMRIYNRWNQSDKGWFAWGQMLSGQRIQLLSNASIGGATVDYLQAKLATDVFPLAPAYVIAAMGINNLTSSDTAEVVIAKLKSYYQTVLQAGIKVIACTILPLGSGFSGYASYAPKIVRVNDWIRRYAKQTKGMTCFDGYSVFVDPLAATKGAAKTNYLSDNLHPSPLGAYALGKAWSLFIPSILPASSTLVASNADNYGNDPSNSNVLDNGVWTTTGGTINAGVTGVAPSGWTVQLEAGSPTVTASVPARADGYGYDLQTVITSAAANNAAVSRYNLSGRIAASSTYVIEAEVSLSGVSGSSLSSITAYLNGTFGGASYNLGICNALSLDAFITEDCVLSLRSEPFTIPAGSVVAPVLYFVTRFSAAGTTITQKIGRVSLRLQ